MLGDDKNHPALPCHPGLQERPTAATDSQTLWNPHNSPHYERLIRRSPHFTGVRPVFGNGPQDPHHPYIGIHEPAYLYGNFSTLNSGYLGCILCSEMIEHN
ncbi:hypothetical protein AVEN_170689-1 [Araneus ventricosus]|uniref:Uncharacterized protein n=1 Tax=Araneus ventricosus TaxID=182803 RepID=A0A4Y2JZ32_ARAVE|nr:hypothetical protein AVEN_170689-1 [Araneus ventricosus]